MSWVLEALKIINNLYFFGFLWIQTSFSIQYAPKETFPIVGANHHAAGQSCSPSALANGLKRLSVGRFNDGVGQFWEDTKQANAQIRQHWIL